MADNSREERRNAVIDVLNQARAMELFAIQQYMNQHYNLDDMDYGDLAAKVKLIAVDEMRHAEIFAERIKELDGEPIAGYDDVVERGQAITKIYPFNATLEDDTIDAYNRFLLACRDNGDSTSMKMFETIIDQEQLHFNYFNDVREHIDRLGDVYLAQIAGTPATSGLDSPGFATKLPSQ
jgi:bacterioferritin